MAINREHASKLRAYAADIEDVLLRWHGSPDDAETLRLTADDLLVMADDLNPCQDAEQR